MKISCKKAVHYISKNEEGKLNFYQKYLLWSHLAICYVCKRFEKQNKLITSIFKSNPNSVIEVLQQSDKNNMINSLEEIN